MQRLHLRAALGLLLALAAVPARASAPDWEALEGPAWRLAQTPHFELRTESKFPPASFSLGLEKLHGRMRLELSALAPWMEKEKVRVWLFDSAASYQESSFEPPPWSNGLSLVDQKVIAVYERADTEDLDRTLAHEMTHVLFESYFREKEREAPAWLTEGLAMLLETPQSFTVDGEKSSPWHQALFNNRELRLIPFSKFFEMAPTAEDSKKGVSDWYVQAYGVTRFLLRERGRLPFKTFCGHLRETGDLQTSLRKSFQYRDLAAFERAWRTWLGRPAVEPAARQPELQPKNRARPGFTPFKLDK